MTHGSLLAAAVLLAAASPAPDVRASGEATFTAKDWGLTVRYPAVLEVATHFKKSYLDFGAWRFSYAAGPGAGTPIVAFALPDLRAGDEGSSVAAAALRIGASRDPQAIATCLTYGMNSGNNVALRKRTIGGVTFVEVPDNGESEMMNQVATDDFRAVFGNACWAIDIVRTVSGTSQNQPEYTPAQLGLLSDVLDGISFAEPHAPGP